MLQFFKSSFWRAKTGLKSTASKIRIRSELKKNKNAAAGTENLDQKLVASAQPQNVPLVRRLKYLPRVLSARERLYTRGLILVIIVCTGFLAYRFYARHFGVVAIPGGEYSEGLIGAPRYINPLLAQTNDVDMDVTKLIFSGLLKYDKNLELVPDLAEKYEISEDQKVYTVTVRENILWHDGWPLTIDDVMFTYLSAQDPKFKSPAAESLRGVKIEKTGTGEITFTLSQSYAPFIEVLTLGILPEHVWGEIPSGNANLTEYNLKPVGSGPWKFSSLTKDRIGNIRTFSLERNLAYYDRLPYVDRIVFRFYPDFVSAIEALNNRSVDGISYVPKDIREKIKNPLIRFYSLYIPEYTAVFFNQKNNELLKDAALRQALQIAIDKTKILTEALKLQGEIIDGPILPGFIGYDPGLQKIEYNAELAKTILDRNGWKEISAEEYRDSLTVTLATTTATTTADTAEATTTEALPEPAPANEPSQRKYRIKDNTLLRVALTTVDFSENIKTAELIKSFWEEIGVAVELNIIEHTRIVREVIRPRNYEALLYGEIIGADPDPFPFWHSSQAQDPGLNLASYVNRNVDKFLEDARLTSDPEERKSKYMEFQNLIIDDFAAIFLYSPTYTYASHEKIKNFDISRIILPSDRFNNSTEWYIKTKRQWKQNNN